MRIAMKPLCEHYDSWEDALSNAKERKLIGEPWYWSDEYIVVLEGRSLGICDYVYARGNDGRVSKYSANDLFPALPCCPFGVKEMCEAYVGDELPSDNKR